MSDIASSFRQVLSEKGLAPPEVVSDGVLRRCPTTAKPHKLNGAYIAHLDSPATL